MRSLTGHGTRGERDTPTNDTASVSGESFSWQAENLIVFANLLCGIDAQSHEDIIIVRYEGKWGNLR